MAAQLRKRKLSSVSMLRSPSRRYSIIVVTLVTAFAFASANQSQARAQDSEEFAEASKLADAGQVAGYYRLGRHYELGRGVEKDLHEAARQYQLAAELGHPEAQYALGLVLTGGLPDSPGSARKSFSWFNKAAQQGHPMAAYFLAMSYETGAGTEPDGKQAFEWYRRAASSGNSQAMSALAKMYATGTAIRLNLANAYAWNQLAGARGFEAAEHFAEQLEARMSTDEIERARTLAGSLMKKYAAPPPAQLP
jgi:TPR repeat protein